MQPKNISVLPTKSTSNTSPTLH